MRARTPSSKLGRRSAPPPPGACMASPRTPAPRLTGCAGNRLLIGWAGDSESMSNRRGSKRESRRFVVSLAFRGARTCQEEAADALPPLGVQCVVPRDRRGGSKRCQVPASSARHRLPGREATGLSSTTGPAVLWCGRRASREVGHLPPTARRPFAPSLRPRHGRFSFVALRHGPRLACRLSGGYYGATCELRRAGGCGCVAATRPRLLRRGQRARCGPPRTGPRDVWAAIGPQARGGGWWLDPLECGPEQVKGGSASDRT